MPILDIVKYPETILAERTEPVSEFDEDLRELAADMVATMYAAPGIGLAAPQVGRSERICVIDLSVGEDPDDLMVLVNPRVVAEEGGVREEEGCLSFPDIMLVVPRPERVVVEAQDLDGNPIRVEGDELLARCLHHEIDHLDGVLFIDRVSPLKRDLARRKIKRRIKADDW
ncbi:MAG: peptide deformylase [Acidobacteria bacterium]|nr:peptide deformylase [Acidobacteriota bacterium]